MLSKMGVRAIVLGGSGNVGKELVNALCNSSAYDSITLISRRPLPEYDNKDLFGGKINVRVMDLDRVGHEEYENYDAAFMLLGCGAPSKVSEEELMKIDCTVPVEFANACGRAGVKHMSALSALGADIDQKYNWITKTGAGGGYYNHVKGCMEDGVGEKNGFKSVAIFRPAAIYPGNANTPEMFGKVNQLLNPFLPAIYNTAGTKAIADAMTFNMDLQLRETLQGTHIVNGGGEINEVVAKLVASSANA